MTDKMTTQPDNNLNFLFYYKIFLYLYKFLYKTFIGGKHWIKQTYVLHFHQFLGMDSFSINLSDQ